MYIMLSKRETRLLMIETFQSTVLLYCFICILPDRRCICLWLINIIIICMGVFVGVMSYSGDKEANIPYILYDLLLRCMEVWLRFAEDLIIPITDSLSIDVFSSYVHHLNVHYPVSSCHSKTTKKLIKQRFCLI